ncbi:hypothetical protein MG293_004245 [Ovis ammon polii]|uniref:Uncharacterized protein n=1 Tax=Ovis ammon polii TaxID=230172 RepID=A0AAD4UHR8_OVIAM|nr:hypothetical protein MG293_004245 [Ovis ammon polii]
MYMGAADRGLGLLAVVKGRGFEGPWGEDKASQKFQKHLAWGGGGKDVCSSVSLKDTETDSSGIIHNVLSPPLTIAIPITAREMDLQRSQKEKTDCLRCAKRAWFCPQMLSGESVGGLLGTESCGMHRQGCSRDKCWHKHLTEALISKDAVLNPTRTEGCAGSTVAGKHLRHHGEICRLERLMMVFPSPNSEIERTSPTQESDFQTVSETAFQLVPEASVKLLRGPPSDKRHRVDFVPFS